MKPIYSVENLPEDEKELFIKQNDKRELSLINALDFLDHEALIEWLTWHIKECKDCLRNAFTELQYKQSSLYGMPLNLFINLYGFYPISPWEYCDCYKWLPIYEKELAKIAITNDCISGFEQYIIYADSPRKAKTKAMLHDLIDGKQGKWVALVIRCCINCGLITKPKHRDLIAEFGNVIGESNYKKYLSEFTVPSGKVVNEINAIEKRLSELA